MNCSCFSSLEILNEMIEIKESAFYGCSGLKGSLTIPDSVISINSYSFYNCSGYDGTLKLSASLCTIRNNSFSFTNFSQIYYEGIKEPNCEGDIGFKESQLIYITNKYEGTTFCKYKIINIDPTYVPTQSPSKSLTQSPTLSQTITEVQTKTVWLTETAIITDSHSYSPSDHYKIKIGIIIGIVFCCIFIISLIIIVIIYILRKKKIKQPMVNPISLLDSDYN